MHFATILGLCTGCVLLSLDFAIGASHWSYNNVDKWPGVCTTGSLQSPIDLERHGAIEKNFNPFQFENYDQRYPVTMKNNKHSVEIRLISNPKSKVPTVVGGSLPSKFVLDHMHFHWESEHTIDGHRYPLELHLVHYDFHLGNITEAKKVKGGLVVLSVLYNLSPDDDTEMQPLVEIIDNIGKFPDKIVNLDTPITPKDFLPCDKAGFFRYLGSLTTPGCDEVVTWTVFTNPQIISSNQVKQFQQIHSDEGPLIRNYRPLQETNGRTVLLKVSPISGASTNGPLRFDNFFQIFTVCFIIYKFAYLRVY